MSDEEYEEYQKEHELLPKWGKLVANVLSPKPTDSTAMKVGRIAAAIASPPVIATGTLAAHAHDEIMYSPFAFMGLPGRAQFAASKAVFGPKPAILPSADRFRMPPRPIPINIIPKQPPPAVLPPRPAPRVSAAWTPPPMPVPRLKLPGSGLSNNSLVNNLRIAEPSWKLNMSNIFKPPVPTIIPKMTLVQPRLGASLPYKSFTSNLHL